jgi:hypothetical protein
VLRTVHFSVITQQVVVISYQNFWTTSSYSHSNDTAQKKNTDEASQLPSSPPSKGLLPAALVQPNLTWPSQTWPKFHIIRNRNEIWYKWGNLNPFLQFSTSDSILEACSKNYTLLLRLCYGSPHCFSRSSAYMLLI